MKLPQLLVSGILVTLVLSVLRPGRAAETAGANRSLDDIAPPEPFLSESLQTAMRKMSVAPGLKLDVYAREPMIQNVVSFGFDEQGRCYVVETDRRHTSLLDIENFPRWMDDDFALRTPGQRAEFYKQHVSQDDAYFMSQVSLSKSPTVADHNHDGRIDWHDLEVESERIRLLTPTADGSRAGRAVTFAEGFNSIVSGVASGVLARRGEVYFACMPNLWKFTVDALRSTRGIPEAALPVNPRLPDQRAKVDILQTGFGVHIGSSGHHLHGLRLGPDGKVYWTVGDRGSALPGDLRGYGFTSEFLRRTLPDCGAVFRSDLDGRNFEIFAIGLRNPMELAFDNAGNLFTVDNDGDLGDKCRIVYLVEGADYGWRCGWQRLPHLGAWKGEMLWGLQASNTAAYSPPPVGHATHGPAGFTHYPGTGLPGRFRDNFLVADFPGGVRNFALQPDGASFTVDNPAEYLRDNSPAEMKGKLLWNLYPTDVDFAPGVGGVFVLDWVHGWEKTGLGRIYRVHDPAVDAHSVVAETGALLAGGIDQKSEAELVPLLGHPDQRVRNEAHYRLAELEERAARDGRGSDKSPLFQAALSGAGTTARLHALWAIEIVGRHLSGTVGPDTAARQQDEDYFAPLLPLLEDQDAGIRAEAVKLAAVCPMNNAPAKLAALLNDSSARVQFFAAQTLGKLARRESVPLLLALLRANADRDAYVRHAAVAALAHIADRPALLAAARDTSPAMHLGVLLAMRRLEMPEVAGFLTDTDPHLVLEAARAVYDAPIESSLPQLAALLDHPARAAGKETDFGATGGRVPPRSKINRDFALRRAVHANFRLGRAENAAALVRFAGDNARSTAIRVEALGLLGDWGKPGVRDRVTGNCWPRKAGVPTAAITPLREALDELLSTAPALVQTAAIEAATQLKIAATAPLFFQTATDTAALPQTRGAALRALAGLKDARLADALKLALADPSESLRRDASRLAGEVPAPVALAMLTGSLEHGSVGEQQAAFSALAAIKTPESDALIGAALDDLLAGRLRPELALDVREAASRRVLPEFQAKLKTHDTRKDAKDELAEWRDTLVGGDALNGRKIFFERAEVACVRCHKAGGEGGEVGPSLAGIANKKGREYILESIVDPNRQIAAGYEPITVTLKFGQDYAGILKEETATGLTLNSLEDGILKLKKSEIARRDRGLSAMPEGLDRLLSKRELRDLIEFVATLPLEGTTVKANP
jgi:quinoprotein glucose dehydrogenase